MRKIYVEVKTKLIINADEDISIDEIISNMHYDFLSNTDKADIIDTEMIDYEVIDSK